MKGPHTAFVCKQIKKETTTLCKSTISGCGPNPIRVEGEVYVYDEDEPGYCAGGSARIYKIAMRIITAESPSSLGGWQNELGP